MTSHFITQELPEICNQFDRVILVPFGSSAYSEYINVSLPVEIILLPARLCSSSLGRLALTLLGALVAPFVAYHCSKYSNPLSTSAVKHQSYGLFCYQLGGDIVSLICLMFRRPERCVILHYWLSTFGFLCSHYLKSKKICSVSIARGHGSDIYLERQNLPVPLSRYAFIRNVDFFTFSHENGRKYFIETFSICASRTSVHLLGAKRQNYTPSKWNPSTELHVLSCAYIIDFKRIPLIAEALSMFCSKTGIRIHWTHIGGGVDLNTYMHQLASHKLLRVEFTGSVPKEEVVYFMMKSAPHIFIHLSMFEGLPVSIMEAMSLNLPCIATSAGGTSELIDTSVGMLLPVEISVQDVVIAIDNLTNRMLIGEDFTTAVKNKFDTLIDIDVNSRLLAEYLAMHAEV